MRQSQITADQIARKKYAKNKPSAEGGSPRDADDDRQQAGDEATQEVSAHSDQPDPATLSGESERIGTRNFDEETPFGQRVAIV